MPSLFLFRTISAAILVICGTVVLGISAHVESSVSLTARFAQCSSTHYRGCAACTPFTFTLQAAHQHIVADPQARQFGVSTSVFTFDAFLGAFTIVFELGTLALRILSPNSLFTSAGAELGFGGLLWIFWIAAGVSTTHFTSEDRSVCKHLNDLFDLPELEDVDPSVLDLAKKILKQSCRLLHAELAFIWIGFIMTTLVLGATVFLWYKAGATKAVSRVRADAWPDVCGQRTDGQTWRENLFTRHHLAKDPFADPQGQVRGPTVGVVNPVIDPNEPIERV